MAARSFFHYLSALDDPLQRGKMVYPLPEIMLLALCTMLAGRRIASVSGSGGGRSWTFCTACCPSPGTLNDV